MSKIKIKAWISMYADEDIKPTIHFTKPLRREVKFDSKFGVKFYECEVSYNLKDELK